MTSKCKDPNYVLISDECKTDYTDAYNNYIANMNSYCSKADNVISNPRCIEYVNTNKFIQTTEFNKNFKKTAVDLCLNNLNPLNNDKCITSYQIKPLELVRREEIEIQLAKDTEEKKVQEKKASDAKKTYMWIAIVVFVLALLSGGGYLIYKRRNNPTLNNNGDGGSNNGGDRDVDRGDDRGGDNNYDR